MPTPLENVLNALKAPFKRNQDNIAKLKDWQFAVLMGVAIVAMAGVIVSMVFLPGILGALGIMVPVAIGTQIALGALAIPAGITAPYLIVSLGAEINSAVEKIAAFFSKKPEKPVISEQYKRIKDIGSQLPSPKIDMANTVLERTKDNRSLADTAIDTARKTVSLLSSKFSTLFNSTSVNPCIYKNYSSTGENSAKNSSLFNVFSSNKPAADDAEIELSLINRSNTL